MWKISVYLFALLIFLQHRDSTANPIPDEQRSMDANERNSRVFGPDQSTWTNFHQFITRPSFPPLPSVTSFFEDSESKSIKRRMEALEKTQRRILEILKKMTEAHKLVPCNQVQVPVVLSHVPQNPGNAGLPGHQKVPRKPQVPQTKPQNPAIGVPGASSSFQQQQTAPRPQIRPQISGNLGAGIPTNTQKIPQKPQKIPQFEESRPQNSQQESAASNLQENGKLPEKPLFQQMEPQKPGNGMALIVQQGEKGPQLEGQAENSGNGGAEMSSNLKEQQVVPQQTQVGQLSVGNSEVVDFGSSSQLQEEQKITQKPQMQETSSHNSENVNSSGLSNFQEEQKISQDLQMGQLIPQNSENLNSATSSNLKEQQKIPQNAQVEQPKPNNSENLNSASSSNFQEQQKIPQNSQVEEPNPNNSENLNSATSSNFQEQQKIPQNQQTEQSNSENSQNVNSASS